MRCDNCGEREAEIHLTQIVDSELTTLHLCSECAGEKGVPTQVGLGSAPLTDFLAQMEKGTSDSALSVEAEACPYCGTTAADFRRTGRLGCSQCWAHFEPKLRALLRRIHGSTQHVGKLYLGAAEEDVGVDADARIGTLRRRLERAIELEDFETAADLRDRIRELESVE
ncbi:MAG: UvrB/UvrC motif-containing protein [Candidatus Palauibacterales bacterium]|nr:UvrB/UvrC motif-containing protein [Candidatus Palauibacterales bacterium]MDP2529417.1 UvrB/UvrC motif-containing protein [Candidatus Palauibacterales bacterium]MDP2583176.1 UvrB/UvrC motif-containing protein [Candidatus Palauibacterales bacterium]